MHVSKEAAVMKQQLPMSFPSRWNWLEPQKQYRQLSYKSIIGPVVHLYQVQC